MKLINPSYLRKMLMLETAFTFCGNAKTDFQTVLRAIAECPTIDAEPIRHGHWMCCEYSGGRYIGTCSLCGCERKIDKYCPNCGAKMDEENNK